MKDIFGSGANPQQLQPEPPTPDGVVQQGLRHFQVVRRRIDTLETFIEDIVAHEMLTGSSGALVFTHVEIFGGLGMKSIIRIIAASEYLDATLVERLPDPVNSILS